MYFEVLRVIMRISVVRNFRALFSFSGREARAHFWPWAVLSLGCGFAAMALIVMISLIGGAALGYEGMIFASALAAFVVFFLLSAAVVRRLHDRGLTGLWAIPPIPLLIAVVYLLPFTFSDGGRHLEEASTAIVLIYDAYLIFLVFLLIAPSDKGPNRFGPPPQDER
jgi:uncharacterized membrane protein YhaH (DUF805 family)